MTWAFKLWFELQKFPALKKQGEPYFVRGGGIYSLCSKCGFLQKMLQNITHKLTSNTICGLSKLEITAWTISMIHIVCCILGGVVFSLGHHNSIVRQHQRGERIWNRNIICCKERADPPPSTGDREHCDKKEITMRKFRGIGCIVIYD
jgi:hypothetical protein